jgi:hypothetical protein
MNSFKRVGVKLLLSAAALATILSVGCTSKLNNNSPTNSNSPVKSQVPESQKAGYTEIRRIYSAAEFEAILDGAEDYIGRNTSIGAGIEFLTAELIQDRGENPKYATGGENIMEIIKKKEGINGLNPLWLYESRSNTIYSTQVDLLEEAHSLANFGLLDVDLKIWSKYHELIHNKQDANTPTDSLETFLSTAGISYYSITDPNNPTRKLIMMTKQSEPDHAMNCITTDNLAWTPDFNGIEDILATIGLAKQAINEPNLSDKETAARLYAQLRGSIIVRNASAVLEETQAYFEAPTPKSALAFGSDIPNTVYRAVGVYTPASELEVQKPYLAIALEQIVREHAALRKAGINGPAADSMVAEDVGRSRVPSENPFEPYEQMTRNVTQRISELIVPEPTKEDKTKEFAAREKMLADLGKDSRNKFAEYILELNRAPRLPFLKDISINMQKLMDGNYELSLFYNDLLSKSE